MATLRDLKSKYNYLLKRYNNGCKYVQENSNDENIEKYLNELGKILDEINETETEINQYIRMTQKEILQGFEENIY